MGAVVETNEVEKTELLTTHYYKTSYENLKNTYLDFLKQNEFHVVSIDDNYCEIFAEKTRVTILAKIIEQNPKETSIDFYVTTEFLFGNNKKALDIISSAYKYIGSKYEIKGLGLHK